MGVKEREGAQQPEGAAERVEPAGLSPGEGAQALAVVLDEIRAVPLRLRLPPVEMGGVAQDGAAHHQPGVGVGVARGSIPGLVYVGQHDIQAILHQGGVGGAPGHRRHQHLVAALQRVVGLVKEASHGQEIGRGAGVGHDTVLLAM